ncbi:MAG: uracil-DNA glycosylase family protein [Muribaculaceae bacterium]|nr:uracil-DNA glycosylase family protein [Muribaculaceae bacterium]
MKSITKEIETHPWPPFIPEGARVLIMGTYPPGSHRWSMDFFYPNRTNDFWYMMGLIFMGDRTALTDASNKSFRLDEIKRLLTERGIALGDTGYRIHRQKGNASDKYLEIIEPIDLTSTLRLMPECHTLATTGEKAAGVIAELTGSGIPRMGQHVETSFGGRGLTVWRMPSTSRAYPLPLASKAEYYTQLFKSVGAL